MKAPNLSICLLLVWTSAAMAQGDRDFVLTEPLIVPRAPEFSAWVADCTYTGAQSEAEARAAHQANLARSATADPVLAKFLARQPGYTYFRRWAQRAVKKTGDIRLEINAYTDGLRDERWQSGAQAVIKAAPTAKISYEPTTPAKAERDFLEFAWVNRQNFKGVEQFRGRKCLVFEDKLERDQVENPRVYQNTGPSADVDEATLIPSKAIIDLETRLPVALVFGEQTWVYTMQAPPTETMTVPAEFASVIEGVRRRQEARNAPLSKP